MTKHLSPHEEGTKAPLPIIIGMAFPVLFSIFFYMTYPQSAWFYQDDFGFIARYANSIQINQLLDFSNVGRFISRNVYWHYGINLFSYNAQYFYLFNFFVISATSYIIYKIFSAQYGHFSGVVAGLFYFMLPATINSYAWLSNSQHIIGHFFVILFVYLFLRSSPKGNLKSEAPRAAMLAVTVILGFASNIFMSMVLSLPIWMIATDKNHRRSKYTYFVVSVGVILFAIFFHKLAGKQTGAYLTSYTIHTVAKNAEFYFSNRILALLWIGAIVFGVLYSFIRKKFFVAWLFIASAAFFVPFAFFVHQRYSQYGTLTYLFFLLGAWSLLHENISSRWPKLVKYIGLFALLFIFTKALELPIRHFSENPRGAAQKKQIDFLRLYDTKHPETKKYCFRSEKKVKNTTGFKGWDIPGDWWFVGFGAAFSLFVNHEKTYKLVQNSPQCDVIFVFKNGVIVKSGI